MRALKLRFAVESTVMPSPGIAPLVPQQAPQPGVVTIAPIAASFASVPSAIETQVDLARRRRDDELHAGRDSSAAALEHGQRVVKIRHAAAGAGAEEDHVDRRAGDCVDRHDVVRRVRNGDARRERVELDDELARERRVGVGSDRRAVRTVRSRDTSRSRRRRERSPPSRPPRRRDSRTRIDPRARTPRRRGRETRAPDSSRPRRRARRSSASAMSFAARPGGRSPVERDPDRLRHAKPDLPGDHRGGEVGRADAGREQIQRAARDGVAVGADDEIAGQRAPALGDDLMADALADARTPRRRASPRTRARDRGTPRSSASTAASSGRARRRRATGRTAARAAHALEVVDRHRRRRVGADDEIDVAHDDVAGARVGARLRREDLLADRLRPRHALSSTFAARDPRRADRDCRSCSPSCGTCRAGGRPRRRARCRPRRAARARSR